MKSVLFCYNPYAFGILKPLHDQLLKENHEVLWYLRPALEIKFPFVNETNYTTEIKTVVDFLPDAIFVPGNEVPYYIRGIKVQIFHGLAGEKKGHFRVRDYFDLYLTQGPYFTQRFNELARKHGNFSVIETGWSKLDPLYNLQNSFDDDKLALLSKYKSQKIILYAPTFSPSLTSAPHVIHEIEKMANDGRFLIIIKYHDLMAQELKEQFRQRFSQHPKVYFADDPNILKYLIISDVLVSDTSSVVYEFLLLDKPVITYKSASKTIAWNNLTEANQITESVIEALETDRYSEVRKYIISRYHPYYDGHSSERMIRAVKAFMEQHGVPERRKLNLYRQWKINNIFGKLLKQIH